MHDEKVKKSLEREDTGKCIHMTRWPWDMWQQLSTLALETHQSVELLLKTLL